MTNLRVDGLGATGIVESGRSVDQTGGSTADVVIQSGSGHRFVSTTGAADAPLGCGMANFSSSRNVWCS